MRMLSLILFASLVPVVYAQEKGFPTDGNGLLEFCSAVIDAADSPSSISSLSKERFTEKIGQLDWCSGYLEATQEVLMQNDVNLSVVAMAGITLIGPDKAKKYSFDSLRFACVPDRAPVAQLARVLVKWLREHPERLHEGRSILTMAAFKDAFPCQPPTATESIKPTTVKP